MPQFHCRTRPHATRAPFRAISRSSARVVLALRATTKRGASDARLCRLRRRVASDA